MNAEASFFDRRIAVQIASEAQDRAGDVVPDWADAFARWAHKEDSRGREFQGASQMIRDADTMFTLRSDPTSQAIAPETHRFFYKGVIYEIVGRAEGKARGDTLIFLCCSRPDGRGARGPVNAS